MSERSEKLLEILRGPGSTESKRAAFDELVELGGGWWHPEYDLLTWALGFAKACAKALAPKSGLSPEQIDWELIAEDALLELWERAASIKKSPEGWLKGVVRRKTQESIRNYWRGLAAQQVEQTPTGHWSNHPTEEEDSESAAARIEVLRQREGRGRRLQEAIETLTPALQSVATLIFIEGRTIEQTRAQLGLAPAAMRQRQSRMIRELQAALKDMGSLR